MPKLTTDLRHQVGQLLILGFDGLELDHPLRASLADLQPGGVILFARNIAQPKQTWKLLRDCQAATTIPMFLCVDLEGGTVDRLKNVIAPAPSVRDVFSTRQRKLFRMHGHILGLESRALGFNTDFAPVLDLGFETSGGVLGSRTASRDPAQTISFAREFLLGLKSAKVLGCGKHFPGLGEANLDTHRELPSIRKPWKKLWVEDLLPYRELRASLPFIMVAHASYPEVTKDTLPASLSGKWITDILRKKIGYPGLIVSDDLEMGGVLAAGSIEQVAVETIRAGADIFLVCHNQEFVRRSYEAVLREAERDRKFAAQVARASQRVVAFKKRSAALRGFAAEPTTRVIGTVKRIVRSFSVIVKEGSRQGDEVAVVSSRGRNR